MLKALSVYLAIVNLADAVTTYMAQLLCFKAYFFWLFCGSCRVVVAGGNKQYNIYKYYNS